MIKKHSELIDEKKPHLFYGYIIVFLGFLILMISMGAHYSFGVFFKPLLNEFGWTRAAISGAYSLYMFLFGFFSIISGRLSDKLGARYLVTSGGFLVGVSYLLMSQINAIWQIYLLYGILLSIGVACIVTPILSTVIKWFITRKGLATGIVASGVGIGIALVPPFANQLITSYSWQQSYIIFGIATLLIIVVSAQFLKHEPNFNVSLTDKLDTHNATEQPLKSQKSSLKEIIRIKELWIICIIFLIGHGCIQVIMLHLVPYATDTGISPVDAAILLSTIGWTSFIFKISMGNVGDKIGNRLTMTIVFIGIIISFLWLQLASALWMFYLFVVVFAIAYGGETVLRSPFVAEYFGLREHGVIFGLVTFFSSLGGALGPLIAGGIFDITQSYYWAFMVCVMLSIVGLVLTMLLKSARKQDLS